LSASDKAYDAWQRVDALVPRVAAVEATSPSFPTVQLYKTSDLGRASTVTLSNDPDLITAVVTGAVYLVYFHLITSGGSGASAGNFKWDWQTPGSSVFNYEATYNTVTPNFVGQELVNSPSVAIIAQTNGVSNNNPVRGSGLLTTTSAGNFALQWAQGTSNGTNSFLRARSFMTVQRIA
jgi:hypothetical protein